MCPGPTQEGTIARYRTRLSTLLLAALAALPGSTAALAEDPTSARARCPFGGASVVFFAPVGHLNLMNGLFGDPARGTASHATPCASYAVAEPRPAAGPRPPTGDDPAGNPTYPRAGSDVHALAAARGVADRVQVLYEFHLASSNCDGPLPRWWCLTPIPDGQPFAGKTIRDLTWEQRGRLFRARMELLPADGFAPGDSWAMNELTTVVTAQTAEERAEARRIAADAIRGLSAPTAPDGEPLRGLVWVLNQPQHLVDFSSYKPRLQEWLTDGPFWEALDAGTRWFAQEAYVDCLKTCVPGKTRWQKGRAVNTYVNHVARLASAAGSPPSAAPARHAIARRYVGFANAVWKSVRLSCRDVAGEQVCDPSRSPRGYGFTDVDLEAMKGLVSLEVYAARLWSVGHRYPGGRLGFAWFDDPGNGAEAAQMEELASRLGDAISGAYGHGGTPLGACRDDAGAPTWCDPATGPADPAATGQPPEAPALTGAWRRGFREW